MKHHHVISTLLLAVCLATAARAQTNPPQITSLISTQRVGTMTVDINYNLLDPDNQGAYVLVECSSDGGATYYVPIYALSGDVGFVTPGNGKHIVWNAWTDWANNYTTNARIRLTADASFKGVSITTTSAPPATNLVWIPNGSFISSWGANIYLSRSFWMGRFEVTQGEYTVLMTNNPSFFTGNSNRPVDSVTWSNAVLYCQRLSVREQAAGRLPAGWSYRLPTDAEWEYACRAGTTTTYYFGNDSAANRLTFYARYSFNSGNQTQEVGTRAPNRWGLYDMYGNVWEWCSDWYGRDSANQTDPKGPPPNANKVLRGGAYISSGPNTTTYTYDAPSIQNFQYGFRVVLAPN